MRSPSLVVLERVRPLRTLFLLLLLANLLFVAWAGWIAPAPTAAGHATPAALATQGIRLLREAPLARELASDGSPAAEGSLACVSAGPFVDRPLAEQAVQRLARLGFESRLREARDDVRVGQWVRLENLATPEDAANALAAVKSAGIADAYVLQEEGTGTVISLGVFADEARAGEAIAIARRSGFDPQVVDRSRPADVFWLDIDRRANAGLPSLEDLQGAGSAGAPPLELRPCPQSEPAAPPAGPTP